MTDFFKNEENHVKKDDKKKTLAKFYTMLVNTGQDLTPHMGKPMSNYDFNKIYLALEDYEGRQQKLDLPIELGESIEQAHNPKIKRKEN